MHVLALFSLLTIVAAQCTCNKELGPPPDPLKLPNSAQAVTSIMLTVLPGTPAVEHQLAITTGAMFDAHGLATGGVRLTTATPPLDSSLSADAAVAYAGYAALRSAVAADSAKTAALDEAMARLNFSDMRLLTTFGKVIADAVALAFPLASPPPVYTPPNSPSTSADATCAAISDSDGWQPLCLGGDGGEPCKPQAVSFLPLFNASLISRAGPRAAEQLISDVPPPPAYSRPLRRLPSDPVGRALSREHLAVLDASSRLNDARKALAVAFPSSAALTVHNLALDEAATRGLDLARSVALLFTVSAAVRDTIVGVSTVKLTYSTIRPITVLQCAYRGRRLRAWKGPYLGVGRFRNTKKTPWRPFRQTPSSPGYVSGYSSVAGAISVVFSKFFGDDEPDGANCIVTRMGMSSREPRIEDGEPGFVEGLTDVPNKGMGTKGYSPARKVTVCWETWRKFARLVARSRVLGGVHIPLDTKEGAKLGCKAANQVLKFVQTGI